MNLDDVAAFRALDRQDMLAEIEALPAQLEKAWQRGLDLPLPGMTGIRQVLLSGMGGSAIGADLLAAYLADTCPLPVVLHRDYGLPAWARQAGTLVVASSHSGETEETLDSFHTAQAAGCRLLVICTGGEPETGADAAKLGTALRNSTASSNWLLSSNACQSSVPPFTSINP